MVRNTEGKQRINNSRTLSKIYWNANVQKPAQGRFPRDVRFSFHIESFEFCSRHNALRGTSIHTRKHEPRIPAVPGSGIVSWPPKNGIHDSRHAQVDSSRPLARFGLRSAGGFKSTSSLNGLPPLLQRSAAIYASLTRGGCWLFYDRHRSRIWYEKNDSTFSNIFVNANDETIESLYSVSRASRSENIYIL